MYFVCIFYTEIHTLIEFCNNVVGYFEILVYDFTLILLKFIRPIKYVHE